MFSESLRLYLEKCGYSKRSISKLRPDTRLYHDLRVYGDIAESYIEVLAKEFGVDMSSFDFNAYFPEEYPGRTIPRAIALSLLPFWLKRRFLHLDSNCKPLTLAMIQEAIEKKKW